MGQTTLSGPLRVGPIKEGPSSNVGKVLLTQQVAWVQSTTAVSTGIILPANATLVDVQVVITTACDGASQNMSMGTTATSTELFTALALGTAANTIFFGSAGTITDADVWSSVGAAAVTLFVDFSAGSAGRGNLVVQYIQN